MAISALETCSVSGDDNFSNIRLISHLNNPGCRDLNLDITGVGFSDLHCELSRRSLESTGNAFDIRKPQMDRLFGLSWIPVWKFAATNRNGKAVWLGYDREPINLLHDATAIIEFRKGKHMKNGKDSFDMADEVRIAGCTEDSAGTPRIVALVYDLNTRTLKSVNISVGPGDLLAADSDYSNGKTANILVPIISSAQLTRSNGESLMNQVVRHHACIITEAMVARTDNFSGMHPAVLQLALKRDENSLSGGSLDFPDSGTPGRFHTFYTYDRFGYGLDTPTVLEILYSREIVIGSMGTETAAGWELAVPYYPYANAEWQK